MFLTRPINFVPSQSFKKHVETSRSSWQSTKSLSMKSRIPVVIQMSYPFTSPLRTLKNKQAHRISSLGTDQDSRTFLMGSGRSFNLPNTESWIRSSSKIVTKLREELFGSQHRLRASPAVANQGNICSIALCLWSRKVQTCVLTVGSALSPTPSGDVVSPTWPMAKITHGPRSP